MPECNKSCRYWPPGDDRNKPCRKCDTSDLELNCYERRPKGRPKGSGQYDKQYRVRLSEKQKEQLQSIAAKNHKTEAAMLRELIVKAFERS